jgi:hypothetical protein
MSRMIKTTKLRVDQLIIHTLLDGTVYAVDSNRLGRLPKIPIDLAILQGPFTGIRSLGDLNRDFKDGFDSVTRPALLTYLEQHTDVLDHQNPTDLEESITDIDNEVLVDQINGYGLSTVLKTMNGYYRSMCELDVKATPGVGNGLAAAMCARIWTLDGELEKLHRLYGDWEHGSFPKSKKMIRLLRYWKLQELTLIRYDLWLRYFHSESFLANRYQSGRLLWQRCWRTKDPMMIEVIRGVWSSVVGRTDEFMYDSESEQELDLIMNSSDEERDEHGFDRDDNILIIS